MAIEVIQGDCLEKMKELQSGSIDLILTDPPYGTMKGAGLDGWEGNKTDWDSAIDPKQMFKECERVLRENGILILFSQEPYTSALITEAHRNLPFLYRMIWLKDHFANALIAKVAPVSYFEDLIVFSKKYDQDGLNPIKEYSMKLRKYLNYSRLGMNKRLGNGRSQHFLEPEGPQFKLCTRETYQNLIDICRIHEMTGFREFDDLECINKKFNKNFNLPDNKKFKSNILRYKKDYDGFHPTQKPIELLRDLIRTYSNEGDTVLDFTMGSGSTGVACKKSNRKFIGIELDEKYFEIAKKRIEETTPNLNNTTEEKNES